MMASLTVVAPERLISSAVITLTPKGRLLAVSAKRVAVTTTEGSVWACEKVGKAAGKDKASTAKRTGNSLNFMKHNQQQKLSPASPPVHERYERAPSKKGRTFTLLAGIRADEATFTAFPCACSRRSVASDES
jgi:hypothetical protein